MHAMASINTSTVQSIASINTPSSRWSKCAVFFLLSFFVFHANINNYKYFVDDERVDFDAGKEETRIVSNASVDAALRKNEKSKSPDSTDGGASSTTATTQEIPAYNISANSTSKTSTQQPQKMAQGKNRSIVLIHVGKAGGSSIRETLLPDCLSNNTLPNQTQEEIKHWKKCIAAINAGQALSLYTNKRVFHMWDKNETEMEQATTFVMTLRNPVDRMVSTYRYHHPNNCINASDHPGENIPPSGGCQMVRLGRMKPGQTGFQLFSQCFPSAAMEDFAQSVMIPWTGTSDAFQNLPETQQFKCRDLARQMVQGKPKSKAVPHMFYNYEYYATSGIWKYPEKEFFGIRTEHEWEDWVAVDQWIGGSGSYEKTYGLKFSHGSQYFEPSPLSTEAYRKLCCVLGQEIDVYLKMFDLAVNLDEAAKQQSEQQIRDQCGVTAAVSWEDWRAECQERIAESSAIIPAPQ